MRKWELHKHKVSIRFYFVFHSLHPKRPRPHWMGQRKCRTQTPRSPALALKCQSIFGLRWLSPHPECRRHGQLGPLRHCKDRNYQISVCTSVCVVVLKVWRLKEFNVGTQLFNSWRMWPHCCSLCEIPAGHPCMPSNFMYPGQHS